MSRSSKAYLAIVFLLILGLAACVPAPVLSTSEASPEASLAPVTPTSSNAYPTPIPSEEYVLAQESGAPEESNEILVIPTLAPTATPGVISDVVNQVAEATNLYETRFMGLLFADWINLAISL